MERDAPVHIVPWGEGDLPLLTLLLGDPAMTRHLGGPESPSKLAERQRRFERLVDPAKGGMFKIIDDETGVGVGSVGYWEREWRDTKVYETGWMVISAFQGRGIASVAVALAVEEARSQRAHRFLHAFPAVDNAPSNAICKKVGFTLLEECEFEYPPGNLMQCNDWRLDLFASTEALLHPPHRQ